MDAKPEVDKEFLSSGENYELKWRFNNFLLDKVIFNKLLEVFFPFLPEKPNNEFICQVRGIALPSYRKMSFQGYHDVEHSHLKLHFY